MDEGWLVAGEPSKCGEAPEIPLPPEASLEVVVNQPFMGDLRISSEAMK